MSFRHAVTAFLLLVASSQIAQSGVLFSTGFDSPPYVAGAVLPGVDAPPGFPLPATDSDHPWHRRLSPTAATIVAPTVLNRLTSQAVEIRGADLEVEPGGTPSYYLSLDRLPLNYDAAAHGLPTVHAQINVRLDGPAQTSTIPEREGDAYSANLVLISGDGDSFGEISLSSDGHVYGYNDYEGYLFGTPVDLNSFHVLALDVDFAARMTTYSLDGGSIGVFDFSGLITSNELNRLAILNYSNYPEAGSLRSEFTGYFDNLSVTASAVPEPTSISLAAIGTLFVVAIHRRRVGRYERRSAVRTRLKNQPTC
ncbi:MAG: hypothetical protein NT069_04580 [Planctomycetota bacterium]|nr:hypothetical protein [Planctomycetota bacterium]